MTCYFCAKNHEVEVALNNCDARLRLCYFHLEQLVATLEAPGSGAGWVNDVNKVNKDRKVG